MIPRHIRRRNLDLSLVGHETPTSKLNRVQTFVETAIIRADRDGREVDADFWRGGLDLIAVAHKGIREEECSF